MTENQFVRGLAEAKGITIKSAKEQVDNVLGHILTTVPTLGNGEKLNLTGIIQFEVSDVEARKGRNPQTGAEIELDATRKVVVRPMATLKTAVKA